MSKRFIDTGLWDKAWFRKLSPAMKCVWIFLCTRCDHAGIWDIDEDALNFFLGETVTIDDVQNSFGEKVKVVGSKLILTTFVEFQYGRLNPENRVHQSVLKRLETVDPYKDLISPLEGAKDKDKEKDKEKKGECEGVFSPRTNSSVQSPDDLAAAVPLLKREQWARKYPDPDWVGRETVNCFDFHIADPAKRPQTTGQWMRKLESWLLSRWDQRSRADQSATIDWSKYK